MRRDREVVVLGYEELCTEDLQDLVHLDSALFDAESDEFASSEISQILSDFRKNLNRLNSFTRISNKNNTGPCAIPE